MARDPVYVRSDIIEKTRAKVWTPARAEAVAARLKIGPMAAEPDPVEYNPWRFEWWPLPMVLAWVAWRSTERVCAAWPEHQAERTCWVDTGSGRFDLRPGRTATVFDMIVSQDEDFKAGLMQDTVMNAWENLRLRLGRGEIAAVGVRENNPAARPPAIDPSEWLHNDLNLSLNNDDNIIPSFRHLLLESRRLREIWPPADSMLKAEKSAARSRENLDRTGKKPIVEYPAEDTATFARQFFADAANAGRKTRRDIEFWAALNERFPGISTTQRNQLHKYANPKRRAPKGA